MVVPYQKELFLFYSGLGPSPNVFLLASSLVWAYLQRMLWHPGRGILLQNANVEEALSFYLYLSENMTHLHT